MATKFIVFVVFAAVAQASLAADVKSAQEKTRTAWRGAGDTLCKAVRDKSFSIEAAKEEFRKHQEDGGAAFLTVAPLADNPTLRAQTTARLTEFREGLFKAVGDARDCKDYATTKAANEKNKNQLPYAEVTDDFRKFTKYTGSTDQGANDVKNVFGKLYDEADKLAKATCGGEKSLGACPTNEIHAAIDAMTNMVFSWL